MPTKLILIRHGQTEWNSKKKYCGFIDIGLNERGRRQSRELRKRLRKEIIHKVYSSDRKRAIKTAEIIFRKNKIERIPDLREAHFGIFEGMNYKEITEKYPLIYKRWLNDPFGVTIPEGENLNAFRERVVKALKRIVALNKGKTIAVVSHGGTISIIINHILRASDFWNKIPDSAGITTIEFSNAHLGTVL